MATYLCLAACRKRFIPLFEQIIIESLCPWKSRETYTWFSGTLIFGVRYSDYCKQKLYAVYTVVVEHIYLPSWIVKKLTSSNVANIDFFVKQQFSYYLAGICCTWNYLLVIVMLGLCFHRIFHVKSNILFQFCVMM